MTFLLLTKKRWPTFLSIWWQSNKRINIWTHRFVLCNAGIFSFSSFAFGPKFSSKIMASAALNITFSRCVCLHPEYEILFERSFRICSIYTRTSAISACDKLLTSQWIAIPRIFTTECVWTFCKEKWVKYVAWEIFKIKHFKNRLKDING